MKKYFYFLVIFLSCINLHAQINMYFIGDQDGTFFLPIINTELDEGIIVDRGSFHIYFKVSTNLYNEIKIFIQNNTTTSNEIDKEKYQNITEGKWIGFFARFEIIVENNNIHYINFKDESIEFFNNLINILLQEENTNELIIFIENQVLKRLKLEYSV